MVKAISSYSFLKYYIFSTTSLFHIRNSEYLLLVYLVYCIWKLAPWSHFWGCFNNSSLNPSVDCLQPRRSPWSMSESWVDWAISQMRGRKDQHLLIIWDEQWAQDLGSVGRDRRRLETISFHNFQGNNTSLALSRSKFAPSLVPLFFFFFVLLICKECVGKKTLSFWCEWLLHIRHISFDSKKKERKKKKP